MKKPFTVLTWLASKISANVGREKQSHLQVISFMKRKRDIHFKSIDSLASSEPFKQEYTYSPNVVNQQDR